jgi:hypothetical protein
MTGTEKELIKFKATPLLRRAIRLRAALKDVTIAAVIIEALEAHLKDEIAEMQGRGLGGQQVHAEGEHRPSRRWQEQLKPV